VGLWYYTPSLSVLSMIGAIGSLNGFVVVKVSDGLCQIGERWNRLGQELVSREIYTGG